jgi:hypothetical protein
MKAVIYPPTGSGYVIYPPKAVVHPPNHVIHPPLSVIYPPAHRVVHRLKSNHHMGQGQLLTMAKS